MSYPQHPQNQQFMNYVHYHQTQNSQCTNVPDSYHQTQNPNEHSIPTSPPITIPPFGTHEPTVDLDNDDEDEVQEATEEVARRLRWGGVEDSLLISGWMNTSKDAIRGTNQCSNTYWNRVSSYYNERREDLPSRSWKQCKNRFQKLNALASKFTGVYAISERGRMSGESHDDVLARAHVLYTEQYKSKFNHENIWRMLKNLPKWQSSIQPTSSKQGDSSKRTKVNEFGAYTSSSNVGTPSSEGGTPDSSFVRPLGRTSSKRAGKRPVSTTESSDSLKSVQLLDDMVARQLEVRLQEMELQKESLRLKAIAEARKNKIVEIKERKVKELEYKRKMVILTTLKEMVDPLTPDQQKVFDKLLMELSA